VKISKKKKIAGETNTFQKIYVESKNMISAIKKIAVCRAPLPLPLPV
jgi:hypothetical protein